MKAAAAIAPLVWVISLSASPVSNWRGNWQHTAAGGVYASRDGEYVRAGNHYLERTFRVSDDCLRTAKLLNRVSGQDAGSMEGSEFALELAGTPSRELFTADFRLSAIDVDPIPGGLRLVFHLHSRGDEGLRVDIVEETWAGRKYQRRRLVIHQDPGRPELVIQRIDVEMFRFGWWYLGNPVLSGYGQPVFAGDIYLGLEYPGAETSATYLRHYPGLSARTGFESKSAVWGVASCKEKVRKAFFDDYLATLPAIRPKPFVKYSLIGVTNPNTGGRPDENRFLRWLPIMAEACRKARLPVDSYATDSEWEDYTSIWKPNPLAFPRGFQALAAFARQQDAGFGLWLSLTGHTLDTRWGRLHGWEVARIGDKIGGGKYCMAGRNYSSELKRTLRDYIVRDHVNHFKFDYNTFGCEDPTHGHPVGRPGKDAQIDAFIGLLQYVKEVSKDVHFAITSGMWLSPWWTLYADWVWLGGSDLGWPEKVKSLSPYEDRITYRDGVMYEDFVEKQFAFPYASVMTHGFWTEPGCPLTAFENDTLLTIGRGITQYEILTRPQDLDSKRYDFLARTIRWGKRNWDILQHTGMILGDPRRGEVYGYTHRTKGATVLFLRNPSVTSRVTPVPLGDETKPIRVVELYPAPRELDSPGKGESTLGVEMLGGQMRVIAIVADLALLERLRL